MPQVQLPMFPDGSIEINRELACRTESEQVIYYNGHLPVFMHARNDLASFRLFTAQLIVQGSATQGDIQRAFGVPLVAIERATKLYLGARRGRFLRAQAAARGHETDGGKAGAGARLAGAGRAAGGGEPGERSARGHAAQGHRGGAAAGGKKKGIGKNAPLSDTASAAGESAPAPGGPGDGGPVGVASELPAVVSGK